MLTEKEAQRCMAYLELARTAIDNAECRIAGAIKGERPGLALMKASGEIVAGATNLGFCAEEIQRIAERLYKGQFDASAVDRPTAGNAVESKQEAGSNKLPV